jgi:hypothetical protein
MEAAPMPEVSLTLLATPALTSPPIQQTTFLP